MSSCQAQHDEALRDKTRTWCRFKRRDSDRRLSRPENGQAEYASRAPGEETLSTESDPSTHAEGTLSFILTLREIFALPRYRQTLLHASIEQWAQAREDYLLCCHILHNLATLLPKINARITADMRLTWFLTWGNILPPLLLALRAAGYGEWMDEKLSGFNLLFDPQAENNGNQDPLPNP